MGNNIIEINGKRYDARKGTLLGDGVKSALQHQHAMHQGRAIDGFVKKQPAHPSAFSDSIAPAHTKKTPHTVAAPVIPRAMEMISKPKKSVAKRTPAHKVASVHQPEKAKTLMRHAVHKPQVEMKKAIKKQGPSEIAAAPVTDMVPHLKTSAHTINTRRQARAEVASQSRHIQRFTSVQQNHPVARRQHAAAARRDSSVVAVTANRPAAPQGSRPAHNTTHTAPQKSTHHTPRHTDLFEAAIANAKSHEQPNHKPRKTRNKLVNVTASLAALVVIAGFIGYLNMSKIEMRVASVRAGFSAQLPGYSPTGYALDGGIKAQHGVVAATYRSGSSAYTLQQQTSDWDSQTLYDNVVAMSSEKQQTVSSKGRTVYVYGNRAAWVNGGVLYSMQTNGDISNQEILSIATSM